jgi:HK97 gp10 family phage protein
VGAKFSLPDDFLRRISTLAEHTDDIAPKVLEAGGQVVLAQARSNLHGVLSGKSSGELEASLGLSPAKQDRDGNWNIKLGFAEPRRDGGSNAKLANIIEHGKHGQPPRPFLKPAKTASHAAAVAAMSAKLEEEIAKL